LRSQEALRQQAVKQHAAEIIHESEERREASVEELQQAEKSVDSQDKGNNSSGRRVRRQIRRISEDKNQPAEKPKRFLSGGHLDITV